MPSVAQAPLMNSVSFMLKETSVEPVVSAFTAVNGRTSPPSPRRTNGVNGMSAETIHVRPLSHNRADETQDRKGTLPGREDWPSVPRAAETGVSNGHHSTSPQSVDRRTRSPESPGKRKRSSSAEDEFSSTQSPDSTSFQPRRRLDSYVGVSRDDSPQTTSQTQTSGMEHSQQRPFPPMDRADHDRNWPPRDSKEFVRATYESQPRDPRRMESQQDSMSTSPTDDPQMMGATDSQNPGERSSTTEITRAGVQVDPKKRNNLRIERRRVAEHVAGVRRSVTRENQNVTTVRVEASSAKVMPIRFHGPRTVSRSLMFHCRRRIDFPSSPPNYTIVTAKVEKATKSRLPKARRTVLGVGLSLWRNTIVRDREMAGAPAGVSHLGLHTHLSIPHQSNMHMLDPSQMTTR
ncbi:uncharacterized protein BDR25DRAFT_72223 [Lindgomyces ingoldianus]|uniref:Uncharacterized protein n=1 Tax=Lindgomyces ingoldianus TaxID=673940 RepID=A0ACB6QJF1_9PLEO|nr:uncharacterized protein BDR25DRAFT_72223 [Lindgomyces ingoldianus]KAF2466997.1 hypothetical protein BDR25DRAFT_72223 [Lindgomyces ingoldianus]